MISLRSIYLKIRISILTLIQSIFGLFGLQIRRLKAGVDLLSADVELSRLAGKDVQTIIEFGAADGRDTLAYARKYPAARVIALEPFPASFEKLAAKAREVSNIHAVQAAVSIEVGQAKFYVSSEHDSSSLLPPQDTGSSFDRQIECVGTVNVNVTTLDEICAQLGIEHVDILKMDAQGSELNALRGATRLLTDRRFGVIYSEVQFMRLYDGACLYHELAAHLAAHDYRLHNLYNLNYNEHGQLCWGDAIFVRARSDIGALPKHGQST